MASLGWLQYEFGLTDSDVHLILGQTPVIILKLQLDFLNYFDKNGDMKRLEDMSSKYNQMLLTGRTSKEYVPPFRFPLKIDLHKLLETSGEQFYKLLLHEPHIAYSVIHKVVHIALTTVLPLTELQPQQVQVPLRFLSIAELPKCAPCGPHLHGLQILQGILIAMTTSMKYYRGSVFRCSNSRCAYHKGQRVSGNLSHRPLRCHLCFSDLQEVVQAHDTGNQVIGLLIDPSAIENANKVNYGRHQAVTVCFQDELASGLELGARYDVAGHQAINWFYAWTVHCRKPASLLIGPLPLPNALSKLHALVSHICPKSPWAFVSAVASHLGNNLYPTSAFRQLKMGLILSLASQASTKPIPILAVGMDTQIAHHLLGRAALLAQRCETFSCSALSGSVGGHMRKDERGWRWLEAGPLVLAAPGVCYQGDWSKFRSRGQQSVILTAIESGQVSFETQQGSTEIGPTLTAPCCPLRSAVWTYWFWNPNTKKQADHMQLRTLINVFGMPYLTDDTNHIEDVAFYILARDLRNEEQWGTQSIPDCEIREFLSMVAARTVTLSDEASQLIRNYFVASRRVRPNCLPVGAISTITSLSESHARLALKDEVTSSDVLAVLHIYEEAMMKLFGQNYMCPPPFKSLDVSECPLPVQVHNEMLGFNLWMEKYLKSLVSDNWHSQNVEE